MAAGYSDHQRAHSSRFVLHAGTLAKNKQGDAVEGAITGSDLKRRTFQHISYASHDMITNTLRYILSASWKTISIASLLEFSIRPSNERICSAMELGNGSQHCNVPDEEFILTERALDSSSIHADLVPDHPWHLVHTHYLPSF
jgi:hypothetical protein